MKKILSLLLLTSALSDVTFSIGGDEVPTDLGGLANSMVNSSHVNSFLSRAALGNTLNSEKIKQLKDIYTQIQRNKAVQNSDQIDFEDDNMSYSSNGETLLSITGVDFTKKDKSIEAVKNAISVRPGLQKVAEEFNIPINTLISIGTFFFFESESQFKDFLRLLEHFDRSRGSELSVGLSSSALPAPRLPSVSFGMSSPVIEPFVDQWRDFASQIGVMRTEGNKATLHAFIREKLLEENSSFVGGFTQEQIIPTINKILGNTDGKASTEIETIERLRKLYSSIMSKKAAVVPASALPENITCSDPLNNPRIIDDSRISSIGENRFSPIHNTTGSSRSSSPSRSSSVSDEEFVRNFNFREFKEMYRTLRGSHDASPEQFLRLALNLEDSTDFRKDLQQRIRSLADVGKLPFSIAQLFWDVMSTIDARMIAQIGDALERVKVDTSGNAIISSSPLSESSAEMRRGPSPLDLSSSISSLPLSPSSLLPSSDLSSSGGMGGRLSPVDLSNPVISSSSPGLSGSITSSGGMGSSLPLGSRPSSPFSLSVVAPVTEADVGRYLKFLGATPRELGGLSGQIARIVREKPQLLSDVNEQKYFETLYNNSNRRMTSTLNTYLK